MPGSCSIREGWRTVAGASRSADPTSLGLSNLCGIAQTRDRNYRLSRPSLQTKNSLGTYNSEVMQESTWSQKSANLVNLLVSALAGGLAVSRGASFRSLNMDARNLRFKCPDRLLYPVDSSLKIRLTALLAEPQEPSRRRDGIRSCEPYTGPWSALAVPRRNGTSNSSTSSSPRPIVSLASISLSIRGLGALELSKD